MSSLHEFIDVYLKGSPLLTLVLCFLMSMAFVVAITPTSIRIAIMKGLMADPNERSSHKTSTPSIGGVPIFISIVFTTLLLTPAGSWGSLQYILASIVMIFLIGLRDDIDPLPAKYKLGGILIAISILITKGNVRLEGLYGLFGYHGHFWTGVDLLVSGFTLVVICNAFNLIDGINGLAGTVGTIATISFGTWFFMVDEFYLGVLAMATAGSLIGFLRFNMTPAKTFMGDTGALVVGLLIGVMAIEFIDVCASGVFPAKYRFEQPVAVASAILVIPLFDTIRVFTTRMLRGVSPFSPDRRHIHHLLIDAGFSHLEAAGMLGIANMLMISVVMALDPYLGLHTLLALVIGTALVLTYFLHKYVVSLRRRRKLSDATPGGGRAEGAVERPAPWVQNTDA